MDIETSKMSKVKFSDIPHQIILNLKTYHLCGVIEYIGNPGQLGSYVAHVKRSNDIWETYDDNKKNHHNY